MEYTFERYLYEQRHTPMTVKSYLYEIDIFLRTNPKAGSYKYIDIVNFIETKQKENPESRSLNRVLAAIKRYYDYLIAEGKLDYHPCRTLVIKSREAKGIIHQDLFTPEELEMVLNREGRIKVNLLRNRVILSLLIYQGLTTGELLRLKVKHIDFDNSKIFIKASRDLSKRYLDILPKQYMLFNKYIQENQLRDTNFLITNKAGNPMPSEDISYITGVCKPLFPERNLNPITIRQSVIANWLNVKKLPIEQVQLMTGHKWISSTEKYIHINMDEQRDLIRKWHPLG